MNLTRFSDIGLQVLILLTRCEYNLTADDEEQVTPPPQQADTATGDTPAPMAHRYTTNEVAEQIHAPRSHVAKVVAKLTEMGALHSSRGRLGGISLAANPAVLTVGAVLRHLEGHGGLITYQNDDYDTAYSDALRPHLLRAQDAFYDCLDTVTILDASIATKANDDDQWVARPVLRTELPIAVRPMPQEDD